MSNVLIVESPAKCQKIRSFLGPDWNVVATMGHIRALEETLEAIGLENGFRPRYQWIKEKAKAIQQLKQAAEKATTIYLASDDDREGEMISYSVCLLLKCSPEQTPRIVFHEITEKAIKHALAHPRHLDMNRVEAQQARAMLDMMIGFTMSPLLWKHVAPTLSAGRCQTPALRLVIEREDAIQSFVSTASWQMEATWLSPIKSFSVKTWMEDELEDEESVQQVLEHAHEHPDGALLSSHQTAWSEAAPQPLITSTLQQQASQLFHCSPKQTMSIAQRLYEAGHITYMRTDKAVMSEEAKEEARKWIIEQYGEAYVASSHPNPAVPSVDPPKKIRRPKTKESEKKESMAQEAHEAIRPTHLDVTSLSADQWGPSERKVYELISRRALQSVMAPARGHILHLRIQMDELEDFPWKAEYKRTEFDGWKRLGTVAALEEDSSNHSNHSNDDEKDPTWDQWCSLQPGDRLQWTVIKGQEKETRSQTRFTEATLVRELERHGIGRPSTFASLLSVIQDKRYVEVTDIPPTEKAVKEYSIHEGEWPYRVETKKKKVGAEKRKLVPTALGRSVWEWMKLHFEDLFAYDFTATMEKQLDHIADGSVKRSAVLQTMWESYADRYQALSKVSSLPAHRADPADPADPTHPSPLSSKQRAFIGGLKAVQTKKGPLLLREGEPTVFFGWPKGVSWESMTEEKALAYERQKIQEQHEKEHPEQVHEFRGKPVYKKTGPYGVYLQWGSVNLPWIEGEQTEELEQRLDQKPVSSVIKDLKSYVIRNGQYGPYIMKKTQTKTQTAKKPVCVSLPKGMDPEKLTDKEVDHLYKAGCEQKKAGPKKQEKKKKTDEE